MTDKKKELPILFLNLQNYTAPQIKEVAGKNWVAYGADNNYFNYLLDRYRGSPTNNAIINAVARMIVGGGLTSKYAARRPEAYGTIRLLFPFDNLQRWAFDLKTFGWYMEVVIMKDDLSAIERIDYTPVQNWRSGKANADGEVEEFYYSDDWTQYKKKQYAPRPFRVYDPESPSLTSVLPVMPYTSGSFYYPSVDYQGALQYANIEEEISNFHLNNILNGFAPSMLINFNNGIPDPEEQSKVENKVNKKFSGSPNAGKVIIAFNDDKDAAATIESVPISDLDKQFQFLSEESTKKIMVGHRVTSPYFFGIRDGSGLGSNADEIKNAWLLWERSVIQPYRHIMLENINFILNQMGLTIPMEFEDITPIEFEDPDKVEDPEKIEQGAIKLSSEEMLTMADDLISRGETPDPHLWELIAEREVVYDDEDYLDKMMMNLASVITGGVDGESEQDNPLFLTRYVYKPEVFDNLNGNKSRDFCRKMVMAKGVYKKEDIEGAGAVNAGWGPNGADTYDIFLYKGGGSCQHVWQRQIYLAKDQTKISVNKARKMILEMPVEVRDEFRLPTNDQKVAKRPRDMKNRGFLKPKKFTTPQ